MHHKSKSETVATMPDTAVNVNFAKHLSGQRLLDAKNAQNLLLNKIKTAEIVVKFADDIAPGATLDMQIKPFAEVANKVTADMTVPMAIHIAGRTLLEGGATVADRIWPMDEAGKDAMMQMLYARLIGPGESQNTNTGSSRKVKAISVRRYLVRSTSTNRLLTI